MRKHLLPALFAYGVGLAGMVSTSAMIGPGIDHNAAASFSPRVWQATHQCRVKTVCDQNGKNCHTADVCH